MLGDAVQIGAQIGQFAGLDRMIGMPQCGIAAGIGQGLVQPAHSRNLEQVGDYLRRVNEVCVDTQSELVELGSRQFEQLQESMSALLQQARTLNLVSTPDADTATESRGRSMRKAA